MPKKVSTFALNEQPLNWLRAVASGMFAASFMMAFVDTLSVLGFTPFSFEMFVGNLVATPYPNTNWMIGLIGNWVVGGFFGLFYAWVFEFVARRASARIGLLVGFGHALVAGLILMPFFNTLHEFQDSQTFAALGFLGSALGPATFMILLVGHLLYGTTMGVFYGPTRTERARMREYEPGEMGMPGEPGVIREEDDPEDRVAV